MCICITFAKCAGDKGVFKPGLHYLIVCLRQCGQVCVCVCEEYMQPGICFSLLWHASPLPAGPHRNCVLCLTAMLLMWPHESTSPFKQCNKSSAASADPAADTCMRTHVHTLVFLAITRHVKLWGMENAVISSDSDPSWSQNGLLVSWIIPHMPWKGLLSTPGGEAALTSKCPWNTRKKFSNFCGRQNKNNS